MKLRTRTATTLLALSSFITTAAQPSAPDAAAALLDHLAGRWVMTGTIGGKQTTHDVDAEWVLEREYLQLHEVSREKETNGHPAYEAIVYLSWDARAKEIVCLWLDNTAGGGLSAQGLAHGALSADSIPLVFTLPGNETLHTTFQYDKAADLWRLTIDDVKNGATDRFADVRLMRAR